jgi:GNAT superfamily N-acetyltransferase
VIELRHEDPDGPAARALWAEYMALVRGRAGPDFEPTERIFGTVDVFRGPKAAWVVLYDGDVPVACAGLRELEPGVAEIKRMFVTPRARGRGHARRLLTELERLARESGQRTMRLFTTDMLHEAMALYASEGYTVRSTHPVDARAEYWLEKPLAS